VLISRQKGETMITPFIAPTEAGSALALLEWIGAGVAMASAVILGVATVFEMRTRRFDTLLELDLIRQPEPQREIEAQRESEAPNADASLENAA
jgi:hypothetical protein